MEVAMKRNVYFKGLIGGIFFILVYCIGYAQEKLITPEMIVNIKGISEVQISPEGKNIVFQSSRQRRDDEKPGAPWSELWMVSASGGSPYRFTYNDKSDRSPRWSPDGKWVAFISTRGEPERAQVFLIPSDGGEARQLTQAENSVGVVKWSPDGRSGED